MDGDTGASSPVAGRVPPAKILLMRPDAAVLYEPTNHLAMSRSSASLRRALKGYEGALYSILTIASSCPDQDPEDRLCGGEITTYSGKLRVLA
jgi:hypothetical protein